MAQRVLTTDTSIAEAQGGSEVTQAAAACENPFDDAFLQNGYRAGQLFYGLLTSSAMTGAQFSVAQVMQFLPKASNPFGYDAAIINIRYLDGGGNAGNSILVAVDKGTGTADHRLDPVRQPAAGRGRGCARRSACSSSRPT